MKRWYWRIRRKLSRLEHHLILTRTKDHTDPKRLGYLLDAMRLDLIEQSSLRSSPIMLKTFTKDVVWSYAIVAAIRLNVITRQNIASIFYDVKVDYIEAYKHFVDSEGNYVDILELLTLIKTELVQIHAFYTDESKQTDIDTSNKRYIQQNLSIFTDYVSSIITAISEPTAYGHTA